jgi:hydroxymethylbilane synthase
MAGLKRAGLFDPAFMRPLDPLEMLPAPGQGALALQCRRDDHRTHELVSVLHDGRTERCVNAERALVRKLEGDCHSPIAALAIIRDGQRLFLSAAVGARDGTPPVVRADSSGADDAAVVEDCFRQLARLGASEMLRPSC